MIKHLIFVTGSSSGIGKSLCEELIKSTENKVIGISRSNTLTDKSFTHIQADLSKKEDVTAIDFSKYIHSQIESATLVNNAGRLGAVKACGKLQNEDIYDSIMLNYYAPVVLSNNFVAQLNRFSFRKTILNISSGAANNPYEGWSIYCSTKAALQMFSKVLAKEKNTEVFCVEPGVVATAMQAAIRTVSETDFPSIEKFIELKEKDLLASPHETAKKLTTLIESPENFDEHFFRISYP